MCNCVGIVESSKIKMYDKYFDGIRMAKQTLTRIRD